MAWDADSRKLDVPFLTDDPMFALGCEFGLVYAKLKQENRKSYQGMLHRANEERICLMASRLGYTVTKRKRVVRGWVYISVRRTGGRP